MTVRLYDVLGRQVRTVLNGKQEGGQEQGLDTSGLSSGVYFLRLEADRKTETQRITLVQSWRRAEASRLFESKKERARR